MGLKERSQRRRREMVVHRADGFQDAEDWDLAFWQQQTPQDRLSALVAIHRDVAKVHRKRHVVARFRPRK